MARKILLADDSVTAQNMGRKILADAGYEVITVNNGSAALKKIGEQKPDLIVLDVYMPGYSGLEVCQRLKEVAETARIPVLLTVGKLEPFKTDEAKRVRADGFIVKPFEASELLSALSKLEDKIVPRSESKPGRFARATAAMEEGRDRAAADEDEGWRNRISFPTKKKETAPEPDADDPAIYNPVNKDLRTVVEHHVDAPPQAQVKEERVDVGALAPEGLPKDVTPEEIAAIAAAAARMQGKILENKAAEEQQASSEVKAEVPEVPPQSETGSESQPSAATFAEQIVQEKAEAVSPASEVVGVAPDAVAAQHEVPAESHGSVQPADEPVTMAAAAGAHSGGSASRWTAVAVALAPEESGLSLEQEMQRAYADFAPTQPESSPSTTSVVESAPAVMALAAPAIAEPASESTSHLAEQTGAVATEAVAVPKDFESEARPQVMESEPAEAEVPASPSAESTGAPEPLAASTTESTSEQVPAAAEEIANPELKTEPSEPSQVTAEEAHTSEATIPAVEMPAPVEQEVAQGTEAEVSSEAPSPVADQPAADAQEDAEHKDSNFSDTTAAAWASWRKIRESGDGPTSHPSGLSEDESVATADVAMAAAAGAEKSPEESADAESDPAIASIVDSVLADLRPKIVEEISRKLGKKK